MVHWPVLIRYFVILLSIQVTALPLVPPVAVLFAKDAMVSDYDLSSLVDVFNGAGSLTQVTIEKIKQRLNVAIGQGK